MSGFFLSKIHLSDDTESVKTRLICGAFFLLFWGANSEIIWSDLCDIRVSILFNNARVYEELPVLKRVCSTGFRTV